MPSFPRQLTSVRDITSQQAIEIISRSLEMKRDFLQTGSLTHFLDQNLAGRKLGALVFFEPSTRTRVSFEMAAGRLGLRTVRFDGGESTSLAKGETLEDTLRNILAMAPDFLVLRHGGDEGIYHALKTYGGPFVNAGDGVREHPTQALLDAVTILERRGKIEGERVLFVGDVDHSRVARSGLLLLQMLGAEVGSSAPSEWAPKTREWEGAPRFQTLEEGLRWCSVCIGLRSQVERHKEPISEKRRGEIIEMFRIDRQKLSQLASDGVVMHPGPFLPNVDLTMDSLSDSRFAIYDQVTNGVYLRAALLAAILGGR